MRSTDRPRRGVRHAGRAGLAALALLLAGCASMPADGDARRVDSAQRAEGDSQIRVFGVSPQEEAPPQEIVRGFLEAIISDEADFQTAREYLTPTAQGFWDPFAGTTVLAEGPTFAALAGDPEVQAEEGLTYQVSGVRMAQVDRDHGYAPDSGDYQEPFTLRQVDDEWRIDTLPDGLVVGEADFRRIYRSVNTFYYAEPGPVPVTPREAHDVLVPDPIYLRQRVDLVGETVAALIAGPSDWLAPVTRSEFPAGARPAGEPAAIDDAGVLTVRLSGVSVDTTTARCERMAAQVLHTVNELGSIELNEVRLATPGGRQLCAQTHQESRSRAPGLLDGEQSRQYFLDEDARLVSVREDGEEARPVSGALGQGEAVLRSAAVSRDEQLAAGVTVDGRMLLVNSLAGPEPLSEPVYVSAEEEPAAGLSAPSWDGLGDLWFTDRDPDRPRLLRSLGGIAVPREVEVRGLKPGQRIESLRVAPDGVRIAMLVSRGENTTLQLGRIERTGPEPEVSVDQLRAVAPQLEEVMAASWAGGSRLVVVGRPVDGVERMQYVSTDGSAVNTPSLQGLSDVIGVAASEKEEQPLLAEAKDGIARLQHDANWKILSQGGSGPFYPG
ncbi:LpqB family beta-propeller domain-containing protein [Streptomyces sp. ACA25]|uniref:LpqB family beta-propeller domain-containing protein n=1 Tax=Streptomyces sp. ACA25 TaxID=3022596 RepID=UPI0023082B87|nr:LpqB family beta-propeller domain-containing protein [Streptomyces sp. ACA25]MDB1089458.1 LpqB family beta-propeller domain-containing protein [Streptomyces sp. ACA25]